jgi:ribosome recycling factor
VGAIDSLRSRLVSIRAGRVLPSLLDAVRVPYHGSPTPILKLASVQVDGRSLVVRPFDPGDTMAIERSIAESGLGLTTQTAKTAIRVPVPPLSQDRCEELAAAARGVAEEARIAVRNVRRDALRGAGSLGLPEDARRRHEASVEDLVRRYVAIVDEALEAKVADVLGEEDRWRPNEPKRKRKARERLDDGTTYDAEAL